MVQSYDYDVLVVKHICVTRLWNYSNLYFCIFRMLWIYINFWLRSTRWKEHINIGICYYFRSTLTLNFSTFDKDKIFVKIFSSKQSYHTLTISDGAWKKLKRWNDAQKPIGVSNQPQTCGIFSRIYYIKYQNAKINKNDNIQFTIFCAQ